MKLRMGLVRVLLLNLDYMLIEGPDEVEPSTPATPTTGEPTSPTSNLQPLPQVGRRRCFFPRHVSDSCTALPPLITNLTGKTNSPPPHERKSSRFDSGPNAQRDIVDRRINEVTAERQERQLRDRREDAQNDHQRGMPVG